MKKRVGVGLATILILLGLVVCVQANTMTFTALGDFTTY